MNKRIREFLILEEAEYITNNKATIRQTAKYFGLSKSTVHKHMNLMLKDISMDWFLKVRDVLEANLEDRAARGGFATKRKFEQLSRRGKNGL